MRLKLRAHPDTPKRKTKPRVSRRGNGRINGLSLATKGPALGHGFDLDDQSIDQVVELAGGSKGRWTHGNLSSSGLGKHLGRVDPKSIHRDGDHAVGDFLFSAQAHKFKPEGLSVSAAEFLMDAAENEPDTLGMSIVFEGSLEDVEDDENVPSGRAGRFEAIPRVDFVGDPGANPLGMFAGTGSELAAKATNQLDEVVSELGEEKVLQFCLSYWGSKGVDLMTKPASAPPKPAETDGAALIAELAQTKLELEAARKEIAKHAEAKVDEYVAALAKGATDANAPIDQADLDQVRDCMQLGAVELAKKLGDALLKTAKLKGQKDFKREPEEVRLESDQKKATAATVKLLEAQGFTVELDDAGNITKTTPPGKE
jgi:hypothetical protein